MSIKSIFFDLDNTIYNYDESNNYAEEKLFLAIKEELGLSRSTFNCYLKQSKAIVKKNLHGTAAEHNRLLYMQNICEMADISSIRYSKSWYDIYWNSFLDQMQIYDYVIPVFDYLKSNNKKIVIVTDLTALIQYRKIDKLGIAGYVDYIVTSEEAGAEKPDKRIFNIALKKVKCCPSEVIMVGDDKDKDIVGAEKLNISCVHYTRNMDVLKSLKELGV